MTDAPETDASFLAPVSGAGFWSVCQGYKDFSIIHTRRAREREPITGVWSGAPSGFQGAEPPWWGLRGKSPKVGEVFVFRIVIFNGFAAVLHEMMHNLYFDS